ncbi:hypothetical protein HDV03_000115 [Kappamyces sp. JEL0829]|nr:hypothetical protein HDV03_000115 [Kappamyces sp. JEL0829]
MSEIELEKTLTETDLESQPAAVPLHNYFGSHFLPNSALSAFRVTFGLWTTYMLAWQLGSMQGLYFYFLTSNGWVWLTLYSWSCMYLSLGTPSKSYVPFHKALFATAQTMAWIVSVGYWTLLGADDIASNSSKPVYLFITVTEHGTNLLFSVASLFLGKTTVSWKYIGFPIAALVAYTAAVLICFLQFGFDWPYPFLEVLGKDPSSVSALYAALLVAALVLVCVIFFALTKGLIWLRDRNRVVAATDDVVEGDEDVDSLDMARVRVKHQEEEIDITLEALDREEMELEMKQNAADPSDAAHAKQ